MVTVIMYPQQPSLRQRRTRTMKHGHKQTTNRHNCRNVNLLNCNCGRMRRFWCLMVDKNRLLLNLDYIYIYIYEYFPLIILLLLFLLRWLYGLRWLCFERRQIRHEKYPQLMPFSLPHSLFLFVHFAVSISFPTFECFHPQWRCGNSKEKTNKRQSNRCTSCYWLLFKNTVNNCTEIEKYVIVLREFGCQPVLTRETMQIAHFAWSPRDVFLRSLFVRSRQTVVRGEIGRSSSRRPQRAEECAEGRSVNARRKWGNVVL